MLSTRLLCNLHEPKISSGKQRGKKASTVKRIMYSAAALLSAGAVVIPTTAASAAPTPQPPPRIPTIHVTEFGNRAVEVRGFMISVGQVTRFIPAADFAQHYVRGGIKLEYAPNGRATGLYLVTTTNGSYLARGARAGTILSEARVHGGVWLFTTIQRGHHTIRMYLRDDRGRLDLAQFGPTTWHLVPSR